jgi:hypothetical protein
LTTGHRRSLLKPLLLFRIGRYEQPCAMGIDMMSPSANFKASPTTSGANRLKHAMLSAAQHFCSPKGI